MGFRFSGMVMTMMMAMQVIAAPTCPVGVAQTSPRANPRFAYFYSLVQKGENASINELLQFWDASKSPSSVVASSLLSACQVQPWGALRTINQGDIPANCRPDVLYSWGSVEKISTLLGVLADGGTWRGKPNPVANTGGVYATISPVGTFNYGSDPIRIRLKPGIRFGNIDQNPAPNRVMYEPRRGVNDFLIDRAEAIESWSFATPQHYDEIVEDILRIVSGSNAVVYVLRVPEESGLSRLFNLTVPERGFANEELLKQNLLRMLSRIVHEQGRVMYSSGTCRNENMHFMNKYR